jgi:DNA-binding phage protein
LFLPIVYATHLANLVPCTHRPHSDVIRGFLERANLPDEVIAFAACVLDALSERFASTWREVLGPAEFERDLKNFLRTDETRRNTHVSPDVVVLAALSLAHGFLIDRLRSARHWSVKESGGMFSIREIEATKRAILQDTDYGLFRIGDDMVQSMLGDMQRPKTMTSLVRESKLDRRGTLSLNLSGAAIWNHGQQTPEPSP